MKKDDYEAELLELKLLRMRLQTWLAMCGDCVGFGVQKIAGGAMTVIGAGEILDPAAFPHVPHPDWLLAAGIAWLVGKPALVILVKALQQAGFK